MCFPVQIKPYLNVYNEVTLPWLYFTPRNMQILLLASLLYSLALASPPPTSWAPGLWAQSNLLDPRLGVFFTSISRELANFTQLLRRAVNLVWHFKTKLPHLTLNSQLLGKLFRPEIEVWSIKCTKFENWGRGFWDTNSNLNNFWSKESARGPWSAFH